MTGPYLAALLLAAGLPSGFTETVHVSGVGGCRSFDWAPDGDLWVAAGWGGIYVWRGGAPILAHQIAVDTTGERGLNAIAVDPDFASNHHLWVFYTTPVPQRNRVSRFTVSGNALVDETVILDGPVAASAFHTGGCLRFARDGHLFVALGDDTLSSDSAQNPDDVRGKVLKIARDGSPAPGNPSAGGGDPRIWSTGLRNPYRCNVHPVTGDLYVADVGAGGYEEIDIALPGANLGWAVVEGPAPPGLPGYVYPIHSYDHAAPGSEAIIGGEHAAAGDFAPEFEGDYFFADWALGLLWRMTLDDTNAATSVEVFGDGLHTPVELRFGPDGALYYASLNTGTIRRIGYPASGNRPPVVVAGADPDHGPSPLGVTLDGSASSDPDLDPLAFDWELGDGATATGPVVTHAYAPGVYSARATVSDDAGNEARSPAIRIVSGNRRPAASVAAPATYVAGQTIAYSGSATDAEDPSIPCSRFTWRVVRRHAGHAHAYQGPLQGTCAGSFTPADRGEADPDVSYEVHLRVEDSGSPLGTAGRLAGTASAAIAPTTATITLATAPATDLALALDGEVVIAPRQVTGVVGFKRRIEALEPQPRADGHAWRWVAWSDAGGRDHEVATPSGGGTFTATFGCDVLADVPDLRVSKGAAGAIALSWTPIADPCLNPGPERYRIYASGTPRPASPPGSFPGDPAFSLAGTATGPSFSAAAPAGAAYYLVVGVGTDERDGPVGHYGL